MKVKNLVLLLAVVSLLASCREKTIEPVVTADQEVNEWVYDNMKTWYYWNDKLPAAPNYGQGTSQFFESLLYRFDATLRPDGDRFSWIQESADELKASLSGESKTTGLEFRVVRYSSGGNDLFGIVTYVLPNSPAAAAGFKRGDYFTKVNGQALTVSNYYNLLYTGDSKKTFTGGTLDGSGRVVDSNVTREMTPTVLQANPVHFDTLITKGAKRIGYVVYHQFIPGPNGSSTKTYDQQLDNIFAKFKGQGINELVIDFRYNRGGYVSSATNLASLIGRGVTSSDVFSIKEYNKVITPELEKQYGKDFFSDKFLTKTQNVGGNLSRVFVLTSGSTASASELLINGLKPYMDVVVVGLRTTGKNVGSITLSDDKKKIKWGIQPIVSKSFNSQRKSEYTNGFTPNFEKSEGVVLYPYGDARDPLLGEALFQILGTRAARQAVGEETPTVKAGADVYSSIDEKAGGGNMFYELPRR
ncbi:S41 family peptidase [Telluribacter sp.]|jgi:C-terminal processing protease CtpA/Prc|uniref:S41 family peptidase n=1 Tax=Telluribacter sp. TaxID=1978767 RepID=UPI002E12DEEF|nr:S41 family peptidase [Telluribacter sp.]